MATADVIDAHTHAFPEEFVRDREKLLVADRWFGHLYTNPKAKLTSAAELLESMDDNGIAFSIIAGFPWADEGRCREHNSWMAEVCREHANRLGYLAIVNPADGSAADDLATAFDEGALGLGELNADAQGFDLADADCLRSVMDLAHEQDRPVMIHASEPVGHPYPGKGTATPDKLLAWIAEYQHQQIVLAHWGGGLPFYELMPEVAALTRNVAYDTAATTYLYGFEVFDVVRRITGHEKILFGSDFPVLGQRRLLNKVRRVLPEGDVASRILSGNAESVYRTEARQ
ncbi:MAG: amidohydrolase family protein [Chloroflexota bacterium]